MRTIKIRPASLEDRPFVRAMMWEAILASPTLLKERGEAKLKSREELYWNTWDEQAEPAFVAEDGSGLKLGAIMLKPNDEARPPNGWRIGIGVEAQVRGQGIGRHLLEHALEIARGKAATYLNLVVDPANQKAFRLYQRVGFVESGTQHQLIEMKILLKEKDNLILK